MLHPLCRSRRTIFAERVQQRFRAWAWTKRPPSWSLVICRRIWRKPTTSTTGWQNTAPRSINGPNSCNRGPKARWCRSERGRRLELRRRSHARFLWIKPLALRPPRGVRAGSALRCRTWKTDEFEPRSRTGLRAARWPIQLMLHCGRSGRSDWIGAYQERSPSEDCCSPGITIRTTPAQRHIVTRGGQLLSASSALGMPSVVLDFAMSCRCQAVGNPLQPSGVMRVVHLHLVGNEKILRLPDNRVNALRRQCLRPLWALLSRRENEPTNMSPSRFGSQLAKERRSLTRQNYSLTWVEIR
jgi:hypothetical protein